MTLQCFALNNPAPIVDPCGDSWIGMQIRKAATFRLVRRSVVRQQVVEREPFLDDLVLQRGIHDLPPHCLEAGSRVGVVNAKEVDAAVAKGRASDEIKERRSAAWQLRHSAQTLGIKLPAALDRKLAAI